MERETPGATTAGDDPWNGPGVGASGDWNGGPDHGVMNAGTNGNISKHADRAEGGDDACRNCGQPGHYARECSEEKKSFGACFNCGQTGHNKSDCTNPKVFTGTCRICEQGGHPAAECPERAPEVCKNCKEEGHKTFGCEKNRVFDASDVPTKTPEEAWDMVCKASEERDMDDLREAIAIYSKVVQDLSLAQLERAFRTHGLEFYIIAVVSYLDHPASAVFQAWDTDQALLSQEPEIPKPFTLINFQGKLDCKYKASYHFSPHPRGKNDERGWPASAEENMERLEDAGFVHDRLVPYCSKCDELGHTPKFCAEEKVVDRVEVKCMNCQELGHRVRDCKQKRTDPFACRNCKKSGHQASECTEPRSAEGVECMRCGIMGHFAKDCPDAPDHSCRNCGKEGHQAKDCEEPRNPATITCRNCEQTGHFSRECPLPTDWSKVICNNCQEMGHTVKRCKQPIAGAEESGDGGPSAPKGPGPSDWEAAAPDISAAGW